MCKISTLSTSSYLLCHALLIILVAINTSNSQQQSLTLEHNAQTLPDHSLLLLTDVGTELSTSVQCLTSRTDCCSQGSEDSDWITPAGIPLENLASTPADVEFYRSRVPGGIALFRRNASGAPEGLYRCAIAANSSTQSVDVVYLGLYLQGNGAPSVTDLSVSISSLTLTCLSSGGPATVVTWTRDGSTLPSSSADYTTSQRVTDTMLASYSHTLTVSRPELLQGNFNCSVSNTAGSNSQSIEVPAPLPSSSGVHFSLDSTNYGNNSLVVLTDISEDTPLACVTDSVQCCQDERVGQWRYPNQTLVQTNGRNFGLYRTRREQSVNLHRRASVTTPTANGVYDCEVNNAAGDEVRVHIGVYTTGQGVPIITSLSASIPTLTLTCLSSGGPATVVTWTRDGSTLPSSSADYTTSQRITDSEQADYTNTLTASTPELFQGNFNCTVSNSAGGDSESLEVVLPTTSPAEATTTPLDETTPPPGETTTLPDETTTPPDETTTPPDETTTTPDETTAPPDEITTTPDETTTPPDETTPPPTAPDATTPTLVTTAAPDVTTPFPVTTPQDITTPPLPETTPQDTTATPPPETTPTSSPGTPTDVVSFGVYFSLNLVPHGNNSLVTITEISETAPLHCITDNTECCRSGLPGEWTYPNRTLVQVNDIGFSLYRSRRERTVRLHRRDDATLEGFRGGVFECEVINAAGDTVLSYIGVYPAEEGVPEVTSVFYDEPSFTLLCTSAGGPASQVTWFRDGARISPLDTDFRMSQRITDFQNSVYISGLEGVATGSLLGLFTCRVENSRGSANRSLELDTSHPPTPVDLAVTPSANSATLTWRLPGMAFAREFRLSYTYLGACPEARETVSRSVRGDRTEYTITGLTGDSEYSVTIVALNDRGESGVASISVSTLVGAPTGAPQSPSTGLTMTSITLTWERVDCLLRHSQIQGYQLAITSLYASNTRSIDGTDIDDRMATFTNLIPFTVYNITIAAVGANGITGPALPVDVETEPVPGLVFQLNGERLGNNSIVDPNLIGEGEQALFCLTNDHDCCQRLHTSPDVRGEWYASDGSDLPSRDNTEGELYSNRGPGAVRLNRIAGTGPSTVAAEMFRCELPDANNVVQQLFLGIYPPNTGVPVITGLRYDTLSASLVCTTSGGPVTNVTWTQEQQLLVADSQEVLTWQSLDVVAVTYRNVLELRRGTERENVGTYRCLVSNARGNISMELTVPEPVITAPDSIRLGVPTTIRCEGGRGGIPDDVIEWVNATGHPVSMATDVAELELMLGPASISANNTEYSCIITNHVTNSVTIRVQAPGPPQMLRDSTLTTSLTLSWEEPTGAVDTFFSYHLTCSPLLAGLDVPEDVVTELGVATADVTGLEEGAAYSCAVTAVAEGFASQPAVRLVTTQEIAPSASPPSFSAASIDTRQVTLTWAELPVRDRNGNITMYTVSCNSSSALDIEVTYSVAGSYAVAGFRPITGYRCWVSASNSAGTGPRNVNMFTTRDEVSLFQLELQPVANCPQWIADNGIAKVDSIGAGVISAVNSRCPGCQLSNDRITNGQLSCFSEAVVTYRAEVHGTAEFTSSQLTAEIGAFARSGESIQVLGVTMTFTTECSEVIGSFTEPRCSTETSGQFPLVVVVGGALGGVIVLMLCGIVVICVVVSRRRGRKKTETLMRRRSNLNNRPENIRLNLDAIDRSSGIYAVIPGDGDDPPEVPPMRPGAVPLKGDFNNTIQNPHFIAGHHRDASTASSRYGPAPDHTDQVTEADYAEPDRRQRAARDRRPSDYEMVFVRDMGMVRTEDAHPLSPARLSQGSQRGEEGEGEGSGQGKEREHDTMKLLLSDLPPLNPLVTNDYEIVQNPHFKSEGNSPPDDLRGQPLSPSGIEVNKNASYGEIPGLPRPRALSQAKNPMYSTIPAQRRDKELKPEVMATTRNHQFADVPPLSSSGQHSAANPKSFSHVTGNQSSPGLVTYDIPPSHDNTANKKAGGMSTLLSNNPSYTYDVPPHRERANTEEVNTYDVPPPSNPQEINTQGVNVTYDVPRPSTQGPTVPQHSHHVMIEFSRNKAPPRIIDSKDPQPFYKYDVPSSNLPAPKVNTSAV